MLVIKNLQSEVEEKTLLQVKVKTSKNLLSQQNVLQVANVKVPICRKMSSVIFLL